MASSNNNIKVLSKEEGKEGTLVFKFLPDYARFLLENFLEDFTKTQILISREQKVPLLKYFSNYSEEEFFQIALDGSRKLLTSLVENNLSEYIKEATSNYVKNLIPVLERESVVAEDITIISLVRRKTLRKFLHIYTSDVELFSNIMDDVDSFIMQNETASFNAFIEIQNEKINSVNQKLIQSHKSLLEAEELAEMGSFVWDIKNKVSVSTPGVQNLFQLEKSGDFNVFMEYVHEEDKGKVVAAIEKSYSTDGEYECEYRYIKNNIEKRVWSRARVSFDKNGEPESMRGTIMDITRRYQLLQRLQESEELNKQAQAITHMGNWTWDVGSNNVFWSDEMYRMYGLKPQSEDITLERFLSFIHPEDRERRKKEIKQSLETLIVNDYLIRIINPDGTQKVLKGKGEVISNKNKEAVKLVGSCQDITTEHNLHQELQEKEEYLAHLIENAPDCIIVFNEEGIISLWNPKTEETFGYKAEEVIGKKLSEIIFPKRHRKAYNSSLQRITGKKMAVIINKNFELTAVNKENREFIISLTISQSQQLDKAIYIAFIRDITVQKHTKAELQLKSNQLERLNLDLELKNEELHRTNKELNSFNYVASHDLQEPLRKIQTFANRIIEKSANNLPPITSEYLNKILHSTGRMKVLIEDLLTFSQTTASENNFQETDLNEVLEEVQSILSTSIEDRKATIDFVKLPVVWAIPFQLQQLLLNIIGNALKYCHENTVPCVSISFNVVKSSVIKVDEPKDAENYYCIKIKDNGIGFESEHSEKIFGLFQRLHGKDQYSGTGIGLAICKKIIHNHKGFIKAESTLNKGSVFYIYLPIKK